MNFTKLNNNGLVDGFGILTKVVKKDKLTRRSIS